MTTYMTWQLARMASCADPDKAQTAENPGSPGAVFLHRCADDARDLFDSHPDVRDREDYVSEYAGGAVPVYTYDLWRTFVDIAAWDEDPGEVGEAGDITRAAGYCLYLVAHRLIYAVLEDLAAEAIRCEGCDALMDAETDEGMCDECREDPEGDQ